MKSIPRSRGKRVRNINPVALWSGVIASSAKIVKPPGVCTVANSGVRLGRGDGGAA